MIGMLSKLWKASRDGGGTDTWGSRKRPDKGRVVVDRIAKKLFEATFGKKETEPLVPWEQRSVP